MSTKPDTKTFTIENISEADLQIPRAKDVSFKDALSTGEGYFDLLAPLVDTEGKPVHTQHKLEVTEKELENLKKLKSFQQLLDAEPPRIRIF